MYRWPLCQRQVAFFLLWSIDVKVFLYLVFLCIPLNHFQGFVPKNLIAEAFPKAQLEVLECIRQKVRLMKNGT